MSKYRAEEAARIDDLNCADHHPACPYCGDLSEPGAEVCKGCRYRLVLTEREKGKL